MKKPAIALAVSVAAVVIGSSVCLPGICGCYSWLGIQDSHGLDVPFLFLAFAGAIAVPICFCWLIVAAILDAFKKPSDAS